MSAYSICYVPSETSRDGRWRSGEDLKLTYLGRLIPSNLTV